MAATAEFLSEQGLRIDGRRPAELRKVSFRMGILEGADGSSYIEQGNTKVHATVYGPHVMEPGQVPQQLLTINCVFSMAVFSTGERRKGRKDDRLSQELSHHLQETFNAAVIRDLYPGSQLDIFVEVTQADGGNFAACINAATLALMDAGVALYDFVCACTTSFMNGVPVVDISHAEKLLGGPELTVAMLPQLKKTVLLEMSQKFHHKNLKKMLKIASDGCDDIFELMRRAVREHASVFVNSVEDAQ